MEKLRNVKWFVIILAAAVVGVFLGKFITNYETQYLLSREYCGNFRGIEVYRCGEINSENFVGHAHILDSAPDILVENCEAMYFTGEALAVPAAGGVSARALGLTQDRTVYISTASFDVDVVYHELFHVYDNANGKLSQTDEFMTLCQLERDGVFVETIDEKDFEAEYFASAGAAYLIEPEALKISAPRTYEYIDALIGAYE